MFRRSTFVVPILACHAYAKRSISKSSNHLGAFLSSRDSSFSVIRSLQTLNLKENHRYFSATGHRSSSLKMSAISSNLNDVDRARRIEETFPPCVVLVKEMIEEHNHLWESRGGIYSLAQGVVYWDAPTTVTEKILTSFSDESASFLNKYGPADGYPPLVSALKEKLKKENGLENVDVMVTSGANQAFMNVVLTLLDENEEAVVFTPYYFNHVMAIQMTRGSSACVCGPTSRANDRLGIPDWEWLENYLETNKSLGSGGCNKVRMVTVVNPGNPTGVSIPEEEIDYAAELCRRYGVWLVVDVTYEQFDHSRRASQKSAKGGSQLPFRCTSGPNVVNIFSFSKGYSLAGFRVGYLSLPRDNDTVSSNSSWVFDQMKKVQDTLPICVTNISQLAALGALEAGREWVNKKVDTLEHGRASMILALSPLKEVMGGSGAMYLMGKLPNGIDDKDATKMLIEKYGVAVIPGSFCGYPGWIRVCYTNLSPPECALAASRLAEGINILVHENKIQR